VPTAIRIEMLPARLGDCLLVECLRDSGRPWRMLVDGGPPDTWPVLDARLDQLSGRDRRLDVAVVTHVDSDHIGGMIPFVSSEHARRVGDHWFNGGSHLPAGTPDSHRERSIAQGESLVGTLTGGGQGDPLVWNKAFDGGPVEAADRAGFSEVRVRNGPRITVLSPTRERLEALAKAWRKALEEARRDLPRAPVAQAPGPLADLEVLAVEDDDPDSSVPNGSSIALLVEHRGASVLLAGDAHADVLEAGLRSLARARGQDAVAVDAFKLPHHGSKNNVSTTLLQAAPADHYLVSSNGDIFGHPDDAAMARVVLAAPGRPTLWFNYRNPRTERWAEPRLQRAHGFSTRYPETSTGGVVLELEGK
jgi:beta-lactamase superfamily II metal-dependent hydrolase